MQIFLLLIVTHSLLIVATLGGNNFGDQPVCEQTKKWLKHSLNALDKCNNTKQCDKSAAMTNITKELIDLRKNLLKKLSDSSKTVTRGEVKELLDKINNYWKVLASKMTKNVQAFDAYGTEFRFKKAIEIEKKRETKCDVPKCNKQPISQFCAEVEEDVEKEVIEQIGEAFQTVQMLQLLATPKKQKHFSDYFFMSFYTREDSYNDYVYNESLKKNYNGESKIGEVPNAMPKIEEMPNAESEIEEMPNAESKIKKMPKACAATEKVAYAANWWCRAGDHCYQANYATRRSECEDALNCAICTPFCLTTMAVGCIFSVPIDTVNGIRACIENAKHKNLDDRSGKLKNN